MATIFQRRIFEKMEIFVPTQTIRSTCWKELAAPGCSWLTPTEETTGRWAPCRLLSRIPMGTAKPNGSADLLCSLVVCWEALEAPCRSGVELADAVVGGKVVSHRAHGGRAVGETVTCGKETGLCASLAKVGDSGKGVARQAGGVVVAGEAGVEVVVVGEDQAFGVNGGVRAPLAEDMERPAAEAGRLNSEPGNSRPGGREAS